MNSSSGGCDSPSVASAGSSRAPSRHRQSSERLQYERRFDALALDVSGFGPNSASTPRSEFAKHVERRLQQRRRSSEGSECELWEDYGVVEFLERGLASPDDSSPEERVEAMRETLADCTDILEAEGSLSDFLFHVARTKYGKIYVRVVRTLLLNRGKDHEKTLGSPGTWGQYVLLDVLGENP
ncbi:hypothetical protein QAD02_016981 [Eretmocerus hayati]|uniref:Uncharacterized protein n=1 Tax=Eretmocerus hayati TaxID=131215 RepID=A0ACC2PD24_9HYME|nr:hypothetical protein QAD02_016981 [Eretmocerus hayati]